uniref:Uncharacterized protein n=1 Tax=Tanacetum cinerariifolium TaxID=118510 RepID=A0A699JHL3_TANCI|nr:hypothetical protein [Tanacetum cinerariifolium]
MVEVPLEGEGGSGCCEVRWWGRWWQQWCGRGGSGDGDSGGGSGVTRWWWRVKESGVGDREVRKLFGFAGKSPPKKFSGGGWWPAGGKEVAAGWG